MKKLYFQSTFAFMAFMAGVGAFSDKAFAEVKGKVDDLIACYSWSNTFSDQRLVLNVKKHSILSSWRQEKAFGSPRQWAFTASGKDVGACGGDTMAIADGSVVVAEPTPFAGKGGVAPGTQLGAHLGVKIYSVRPGNAVPACTPVQLDCTSPEISAAPAFWTCQVYDEATHNIQPNILLTRVDEALDPRCAIFQDGFVPTPAPTITATPAP